jgi:hypothetical protein
LIWSSSDEISDRARKYIGNPRLRDYRQSFNAAYAKLEEGAASINENLVHDLSTDMEVTIELMNDAIQFLADSSPGTRTRDEVVVDSQAWPFAFTDEAKEFAKANGCKAKSGKPYVEWIAKNYNWSVKSDPIPGWSSRLESLKKEKDYHKALKRYCDFMRQTEDIRSKLDEAAEQLDAHIQQQIDIARGK